MRDPQDSPDAEHRNTVELTDTLYYALRREAARQMAMEWAPQTLQATALVHEAWLRVGADRQPEWANRYQFFSAAAEAMRRILVERARRRVALRHGGGQVRIDLDDGQLSRGIDCIATGVDDDLLLGVHEALDFLEAGDPESAELVKFHYFAGLTVAEAAQLLGISKRTAERRLAFAQAWLKREMERDVDV